MMRTTLAMGMRSSQGMVLVPTSQPRMDTGWSVHCIPQWELPRGDAEGLPVPEQQPYRADLRLAVHRQWLLPYLEGPGGLSGP